MARVTVVIPLYNKASQIAQTIDSVLKQTVGDFQLVVVDDGSTDGSGDVVRRFTDPRVCLIVQKNAGVSAARNRGVAEANGDLVAFLDADDQWLPDFLETALTLRDHFPEAGIYGVAYDFVFQGRRVDPGFVHCRTVPEGGLLDDYFLAATGSPPISASTVMIPKRVLLECGGFPVGIRAGEDLDTWARIALHYRVAWAPKHCALVFPSFENRLDTKTLQAYASVIDALAIKGQACSDVPGHFFEYIFYNRLHVAKQLLLSGEKKLPKRLLAESNGTKLFKRQYLRVQVALLFPTWFVRSIMRIVRACGKRRWGGER
jgi:glycosyltransferase involved in cell wall biosynthesis